MNKIYLCLMLFNIAMTVYSQVRVSETDNGNMLQLTHSCISVSASDEEVVRKAAQLFANDVCMVSGRKVTVDITDKPKGKNAIIAGTIGKNAFIDKLIKSGKIDISPIIGGWEQYLIKTLYTPAKGIDKAIIIVGSDRRGTAYGLLKISEEIGVSPWYWWADVPTKKLNNIFLSANYISEKPTVKYRGIFINDEDWGLKPWASNNFEKKLGDIGPQTYAKVCELILRLKGNMLAPAMHSCTGAFYSHPESKLVADSFGIIITTSHCEPLLLNNAAKSEWNQQRDGDWNYKTNHKTIIQKWNDRLSEASGYENIYTTAMRGLHDSGLRGNLPMTERVPLIEQAITDQRALLEQHKGLSAESIPQIFVPYKETMDIYENGLSVPDDITLVWVDDNYGYMKRVSNPEEQKRSGGAGVYYHLSYLGAPHDYLWINTTPPVLMYEELKKAYDTGADRYWLLNVGDIKPMELGIQTFFDMAWNIHQFSFDNVNKHQSSFLSGIFGRKYQNDLQFILDEHYRLAWSRKPEFMGWEREWDKLEYTGLKETEYSFKHYNEAQRRLADYKHISDKAETISSSLPAEKRPAFFEMLAFPVKGAYQMNRKFLMAQLNHELLKDNRAAQANWAARQMEMAYDSIQTLNNQYNTMLNGKWNGIMDLAPGLCALYQNKPEVTYTENKGEEMVNLSCETQKDWLENCCTLNLSDFKIKNRGKHEIELVRGIGYNWQVLQLGKPTESIEDAINPEGPRVEYCLPKIDADSVTVYVYTVPFFPLYEGRSTTIGVNIDHQQPQLYKNEFKEYSKEWKDQVLQNGDVKTFRFTIDKTAKSHTLSFICGDPGMMIQKVIIDWGGLKRSYIGPSSNIIPRY